MTRKISKLHEIFIDILSKRRRTKDLNYRKIFVAYVFAVTNSSIDCGPLVDFRHALSVRLKKIHDFISLSFKN